MTEELEKKTPGPLNKISKKNLLIHVCCGPCAIIPIKFLKDKYNITVFYYNPCITDYEEYKKREETLQKVINKYEVSSILIPYSDDEKEKFLSLTKKFADEKEGGDRCSLCFNMRLEKTAKEAKELGFDYFSTSLSISPYKNREVIESIAKKISEKNNIKFISDGVLENSETEAYQESIRISKELNLYRQKFCGCEYSLH